MNIMIIPLGILACLMLLIFIASMHGTNDEEVSNSLIGLILALGFIGLLLK